MMHISTQVNDSFNFRIDQIKIVSFKILKFQFKKCFILIIHTFGISFIYINRNFEINNAHDVTSDVLQTNVRMLIELVFINDLKLFQYITIAIFLIKISSEAILFFNADNHMYIF